MRVAINGIGVAGPTLAYWLREYGHEPVLFEKASALRTGGYVIDFWGLGYQIAERMGLLPALSERAYLVNELRLVDEKGAALARMGLGPARGALDGRFMSLPRGDIADALFQACQGVEARFGVSVTELEQRGSDVLVQLSDGSREPFDLVVGADGLHSKVRELLFGSERQFERHLGCHVAAYRIAHYPQRDELAYLMHTVPKRQAARMSLRDDRTLVLLVFRSELLEREPTTDDERKAALGRVFADVKWEVPDLLSRLSDVDDLYFDRVSQICLPRWGQGRAALVGDAAACASLLAGEGTGLAMTEAFVLAGELHRAAGDPERALASYESRLRGFIGKKQESALGYLNFFAPPTQLSLKLRNWGFRAASVPALTRLVARYSFRDELELPDYDRSRA